MEIKEPSDRLMRWRLRLEEFDIDVRYRNEFLNIQADALFRLRTLDETVVPIEEVISCLYFEAQTCSHEKCQADGLDGDLEVSDLLLLVSGIGAEPLVVPITKEALLLEQQKETFYQNVMFYPNQWNKILFSFNSEGVLF